jgi:hypothetical protein
MYLFYGARGGRVKIFSKLHGVTFKRQEAIFIVTAVRTETLA